MQNVCSQKSAHTEEDNLDLARSQTLLSSIPDAIAAATTAATAKASQEGIQSEPEACPKVKTRSRFTSALRKLSKSKRKKDISKELPEKLPSTAAEVVLSSGGEETAGPVEVTTTVSTSTSVSGTEEKPKKKSKLTRRFILGSLRKSKISPKKSSDTTADNEVRITAGSIQADTKDISNKYINIDAAETATDVNVEPSERGSKVKIIISGREVEQTQVGAEKPVPSKSPPADSDYLTPTEDVATSSQAKETTTVACAATKETKKKKLKLKKNSSGISSTKTQTAAAPLSAQTTIIRTTPTNEEKYVITQSARDTPPPERAPAKPSRAVVTTSVQSSSSSSQTLVVRKPTTRATAILTTPSQQQQQRAISTSKNQRATTTAASESSAKGLMQKPVQVTLQRGHRFPSPTTTRAFSCSDSGNATPLSTTATKSTDAAVPAAKSSTAQQQRQIKFQLQSHASPSQSLPLTPPEEDEEKEEHIEKLRFKSNASNDLLQPPTHPPPPIPTIPTITTISNSTPFATPETRSPTHRRQQSETASLQVNATDDSVGSVHSSGPDDAISSAESANPLDSYPVGGNNIQSQHLAGHTFSQDSQSCTLPTSHSSSTDASTIRFAVGSAVRPIGTSFDTLRDQQSIDSDRSFDSLSPISESSRKRIPYVAQPTLYDEFESLQRRRETLKYQTGFVSKELSLESDNDDSSGDQSSMPAFGDLTMDQEMEPAIMTSSSSEKREHLYKILVIGELGTGKTSFIKRYVHQFFSQNYRATIGVDFALKVLHWDKDTVVRLQLWDIAGQERFGNMTRVYYKEAVGAFIVFDVTRSGTFDCVNKWKEDLDSKVQLPDGSPIPCILLANKCDQEKQGLVTSPEKMDEYVNENGFAGWFETSAKENINIDEAARALVNKILLNDKLINAADIADSEKFNLNNSEDQAHTEPKSKCSC